MNNFEINKQLNQVNTDLGVINLVYISKDTKSHLQEGVLRDLSGEGIVVKTININPTELTPDKLTKKLNKISALIDEFRLAGVQADGTLLVHENFVNSLSGDQTVIIKNKESGVTETRLVTVKGISGSTYSVVLKSLHDLAASLGRLTPVKKEEEEKSPPAPTETRVAAPRSTRTPSPNNQVRQMEKQLHEISSGQNLKAQEAREKEKTEQKERIRQEKEQAYLKKENLKYDLKQENIHKDAKMRDENKI